MMSGSTKRQCNRTLSPPWIMLEHCCSMSFWLIASSRDAATFLAPSVEPMATVKTVGMLTRIFSSESAPPSLMLSAIGTSDMYL